MAMTKLHKRLYPEQWSHPLVGKTVRASHHALKMVCVIGVVERVIDGKEVVLKGKQHPRERIYPIGNVEIIGGKG